MSAKTAAVLTTDTASNITGQTVPESITPAVVGALLTDFIDSFWNKTDTPFTLPPTTITKAGLAALIGGSTVVDKRWYQITDRTDSNPLFVQGQGINKISPFGIQTIGGKPLFVVMDYTGTYEGETLPFLLKIDENRKVNLNPVTGNSNYGISTILRATATLNFGYLGAVSAQTNVDLTMTVTGAAMGDPVVLGIPNAAAMSSACGYIAWVSAANTITIRFFNASAGGITPGIGDFTAMIIK